MGSSRIKVDSTSGDISSSGPKVTNESAEWVGVLIYVLMRLLIDVLTLIPFNPYTLKMKIQVNISSSNELKTHKLYTLPIFRWVFKCRTNE